MCHGMELIYRTDSIESLNLVENYVPPGQEEEPLDPILASVVSFSLPLSRLVIAKLQPLLARTFMMKHFSDVKPYGALSESAKTMWTPPLPSF